jgi:hypothetical protein
MVIGHTSARKLTYRDYLRFPDDGMRHEILDGEHYVTPAPSFGHQSAVRNLVQGAPGPGDRDPLEIFE